MGLLSRFPFETIGEHGKLSVLLHADYAAVAVLVDGEAALLVERQAIGARLAIFANVHATIAGLRHEDGKLAILRPAIDHIVVGVAEEEIAVGLVTSRHPDWTFGEQKSARQFFDFRILRGRFRRVQDLCG